MEVWKTCASNENYEVSNLGSVRRVTKTKGAKPGLILKQATTKNGYRKVSLSSGSEVVTHLVHRLVAEAWLPDFDFDRQVAHNDGNPSNNKASNLRMATPKENSADTLRHGTRSLGSRRPMAKLSEEQVILIRADQRKHRK